MAAGSSGRRGREAGDWVTFKGCLQCFITLERVMSQPGALAQGSVDGRPAGSVCDRQDVEFPE